MSKESADSLPPEIRLIAAVSRLIDIHQSRRDSSDAYTPRIPESAGANLFLAMSIIECLHEIEMDRGIGAAPISELVGAIRKRIPDVTDEDIEFCIANMKQAREIRYRTRTEDGGIVDGRTWETTTLLEVQEGFSQVQLTENARLLLRVSSLKESWLYSDLDADRLIKAIERGQFQDIPGFCRAMSLDLASKSKKLSGALERPSLSELRSLLISEGGGIASSLGEAAATISQAIELIFDNRTKATFEEWAARNGATFFLGNIQADLELVLQNVESLSRRFLEFIGQAQRVRNEGIEPIKFLEIADHLIRAGNEAMIERVESLFRDLLPSGQADHFFHPLMLVGSADLSVASGPEAEPDRGFTVDPGLISGKSRFVDFLKRNRAVVLNRLDAGPVSFSEMVELGGFALQHDESPLDFFGVYASPGMLDVKDARIVVGITDVFTSFIHSNFDVTCTDPVMYLEKNNDPD